MYRRMCFRQMCFHRMCFRRMYWSFRNRFRCCNTGSLPWSSLRQSPDCCSLQRSEAPDGRFSHFLQPLHQTILWLHRLPLRWHRPHFRWVRFRSHHRERLLRCTPDNRRWCWEHTRYRSSWWNGRWNRSWPSSSRPSWYPWPWRNLRPHRSHHIPDSNRVPLGISSWEEVSP